MPFLKAFLIWIGGNAYGREIVDALSVDQIIDEIFRWFQLPLSPPESQYEWAWEWTQHGALNETVSTIAYNIDKISCSQFAKLLVEPSAFGYGN